MVKLNHTNNAYSMIYCSDTATSTKTWKSNTSQKLYCIFVPYLLYPQIISMKLISKPLQCLFPSSDNLLQLSQNFCHFEQTKNISGSKNANVVPTLSNSSRHGYYMYLFKVYPFFLCLSNACQSGKKCNLLQSKTNMLFSSGGIIKNL